MNMVAPTASLDDVPFSPVEARAIIMGHHHLLSVRSPTPPSTPPSFPSGLGFDDHHHHHEAASARDASASRQVPLLVTMPSPTCLHPAASPVVEDGRVGGPWLAPRGDDDEEKRGGEPAVSQSRTGPSLVPVAARCRRQHAA
ncbi:hypothetical protein RJ55_07053 [Drechmeria coniospora]|nr:hypothetical protein RJ55_07053 [Drechmeria coniospora]